MKTLLLSMVFLAFATASTFAFASGANESGPTTGPVVTGPGIPWTPGGGNGDGPQGPASGNSH